MVGSDLGSNLGSFAIGKFFVWSVLRGTMGSFGKFMRARECGWFSMGLDAWLGSFCIFIVRRKTVFRTGLSRSLRFGDRTAMSWSSWDGGFEFGFVCDWQAVCLECVAGGNGFVR